MKNKLNKKVDIQISKCKKKVSHLVCGNCNSIFEENEFYFDQICLPPGEGQSNETAKLCFNCVKAMRIIVENFENDFENIKLNPKIEIIPFEKKDTLPLKSKEDTRGTDNEDS